MGSGDALSGYWLRFKFVVSGPIRAFGVFRRSFRMWKTMPALQFSDEIRTVRRPKFDWLLAGRLPMLTVCSDESFRPGLLQIESMYSEVGEVRSDPVPYETFAGLLVSSGLLSGARYVTDVGCATGHLLFYLRELMPSLMIGGIEYFEFHRLSSPPEISPFIRIADIRRQLDVATVSDVVICTEVAEHIDPAALHVFMANLARLTGNTLILTWSSTFPPPGAPPQHVCSLNHDEVRQICEQYGFEFDRPATHDISSRLRRATGVYPWWADSISVWRRIDSMRF